MQSRTVAFGLGTLVGLSGAIGISRWNSREENATTKLLEEDTEAEKEKLAVLQR